VAENETGRFPGAIPRFTLAPPRRESRTLRIEFITNADIPTVLAGIDVQQYSKAWTRLAGECNFIL
jgi:hypothetical protein